MQIKNIVIYLILIIIVYAIYKGDIVEPMIDLEAVGNLTSVYNEDDQILNSLSVDNDVNSENDINVDNDLYVKNNINIAGSSNITGELTVSGSSDDRYIPKLSTGYHGEDSNISSFKIGLHECKAKCSADPDCDYAMEDKKGSTCWLKKKVPSIDESPDDSNWDLYEKNHNSGINNITGGLKVGPDIYSCKGINPDDSDDSNDSDDSDDLDDSVDPYDMCEITNGVISNPAMWVGVQTGDGNTALELGRNIDKSTFIDFHTSSDGPDYNARILSGPEGNLNHTAKGGQHHFNGQMCINGYCLDKHHFSIINGTGFNAHKDIRCQDKDSKSIWSRKNYTSKCFKRIT